MADVEISSSSLTRGVKTMYVWLCMAVDRDDGWRCAGFLHLVCAPLDTREKDVLYVGFASEDVTLHIVRSCVALGISLCSQFLVCC